MATKRELINDRTIQKVTGEVLWALDAKFEEKGRHGLASTHEILGILDEEVKELKDAIHDNDLAQTRKELVDTVVAALWGLISIEDKTINW